MRVNTAALASAGQGLLDAANKISAAPERFSAATGDPLSAVGLAHQQAVEASLIEGLPVTKQDAVGSAEKIMRAAQNYAASDQQLGGDIKKYTFGNPDSCTGASGGGSGLAPGVGGGGAVATAGSAMAPRR
ncbi:MAG: hypothetical protein ACRDRD_09550 [Pseudonocardiaceae bacterium]